MPNDTPITYKAVLVAVFTGFLALAGFAAWLVDKADATVHQHTMDSNPHHGIEARFQAMEGKLDKIVLLLLDLDRNDRVTPPSIPSSMSTKP